jgi:hypothetical protein
VSIGAWRWKDWYLHDIPAQLLVRLSGEETFSILRLPTRPPPADLVAGWHNWTGGEELSECFWKIVDLTDRDLELGQPSWIETSHDGSQITRCSAANAAYVKLVPLTDAEVRSFEADATRATVPLYAHNDVSMTQSNTPEELHRHIEPFGDSDFSRMYWEGAMGDLSYYFQTRNGTDATAPAMAPTLFFSGGAIRDRWPTTDHRGTPPADSVVSTKSRPGSTIVLPASTPRSYRCEHSEVGTATTSRRLDDVQERSCMQNEPMTNEECYHFDAFGYLIIRNALTTAGSR